MSQVNGVGCWNSGLSRSRGHWLAPRNARKDYITAKYIERKYARKRHADAAAKLHSLCEAVKTRDIFGLLQAYANGVDLTEKVPLANGHVSAWRGRELEMPAGEGRSLWEGGGLFQGSVSTPWALGCLGAGPQHSSGGHRGEERPGAPLPRSPALPRPLPPPPFPEALS